MSHFEVPIVRVDAVENHPNADRLSLVTVRGWTCISGKLEDGSPRYKVGDLVAYVPEASLVPEWLLKSQGFWDESTNRGMLSGAGYNRVKAIRLRGVVSQGILVPVVTEEHSESGGSWEENWIKNIPLPTSVLEGDPFFTKDRNGEYTQDVMVEEGDDVAEVLGITKYEPPIPGSMQGVVRGDFFGYTLNYDIDNIKSWPDAFEEGEEVVMTEKLHGTFCQIGYHPDKGWYVASKGLGAKGYVFDLEKTDNVYTRAFKEHKEKLEFLRDFMGGSFIVCGEIAGRGIQDLHYDLDKPEFRVFDIYCWDETIANGTFMDFATLFGNLKYFDLPSVPVLYTGPYSKIVLDMYTSGNTEIGFNVHIREGIVIKPAIEHLSGRKNRYHHRVIVKSINDAYLMRKGETTELQ